MNGDSSFLISHGDDALVRRLVDQQFPQYSHLTVEYRATGWDNVMFALGDKLAVRLPRRPEALAPQLNELQWLNTATAPLTTRVSHIAHIAQPSQLFPYPWAIIDWMEGIRSMSVSPHLRDTCAAELGSQLALLHQPAPANAPVNPYRGVPLAERASVISQRIASAPALAPIRSVWESALDSAPYTLAPVWCHGDLHPGNYIVDSHNELAGIIDFGDITAGDPAVDLATAWVSFTQTGRDQFFDAYLRACDPQIAADSGLMQRARGWAVATFISSVLTNTLSTEDFAQAAHWAMDQLVEECA